MKSIGFKTLEFLTYFTKATRSFLDTCMISDYDPSNERAKVTIDDFGGKLLLKPLILKLIS